MPKNGKGSSRSPAARAGDDERAERELNTEITAAVAATEREITDFVNSDDPLDLDGDMSLEEMGDGLEGDDLIDDGDDEDEVKRPVTAKGKRQAARGEEDDDGDEDQGDDDLEADDDDVDGDEDGDEDDGNEDDDADDRVRDTRTGRFVPASRVKEEADKRRSRERDLDERDIRIAELEAAVNELRPLATQRPAPAEPETKKPAAPPKPDMFAEPEAYEAWMEETIDRRVTEGVTRAVQAATAQSSNERANEAFADAATGERRFEFHAAYQALTSLPKNSENARLATKILRSRNPADALFDWWEDNGGPEYRDEVAQALGLVPAQRRQERGDPSNGSRNQPQGGQRQVFRGAQRLRSLNGTAGGGRHQVDPRSLDDSDAAVASYIFER